METVNIGLMGLGTWASDAYAPVLGEREDVRVVAVAARSEATFARARELFGDAITEYTEIGDLAADREIDAIMIALPNRLHTDAALTAIASGRHVFAEPPVGFDAAGISAVFAAASASPAIFQTDLELRCTPVMDVVAEQVASGALGEGVMAKVRLWCGWGYGGGEWQAEAEDQGFFLWLGCWYLDVLDRVFGALPLRVSVMGGRAMNGDLIDHGWALLEYPGGLGQLEFSLVVPEEQRLTVGVAGTEGEIEADLWSGDCRRRGRGEDWQERSVPPSQPVHGFAGMRESISDFLECVRSGGKDASNLAASRRVHAAALACMRSAETGETVTVAEL